MIILDLNCRSGYWQNLPPRPPNELIWRASPFSTMSEKNQALKLWWFSRFWIGRHNAAFRQNTTTSKTVPKKSLRDTLVGKLSCPPSPQYPNAHHEQLYGSSKLATRKSSLTIIMAVAVFWGASTQRNLRFSLVLWSRWLLRYRKYLNIYPFSFFHEEARVFNTI